MLAWQAFFTDTTEVSELQQAQVRRNPEANCISMDQTLFFYTFPMRLTKPVIAKARAACENCPLKEECAAEGRLIHKIGFAIYGAEILGPLQKIL